jgi:hypothetical protein
MNTAVPQSPTAAFFNKFLGPLQSVSVAGMAARPQALPKALFLILGQRLRLYALAGLWDAWKGPDGWLQSYSVITVQANPSSAANSSAESRYGDVQFPPSSIGAVAKAV